MRATLVKFKFEDNPNTGDSDYHLVLADEAGHTMIAEVPFPECVEPASPFASGIANARQTMDSKFTASSSFQSVNLPVEVVGVGFFDVPHGQAGHAPNCIELHPVLSITFNPGVSDTGGSGPGPGGGTPPGGPAEPPIINGGFETATDAGDEAPPWVVSSSSGGSIFEIDATAPQDGNNDAALGGTNRADQTLEQALTIPVGFAHPTLSFWVNVVTREPATAGSRDRLAVEIRDSAGTVLKTLAALDNRDSKTTGNRVGEYAQVDGLDLSEFVGRSVKLVFHATTNASRPTVFRIDDVGVTSAN